MNLIEKLNRRYATKRMNGTTVPAEKVESILESIRLAPTSYGLQPFKVLVVEDPKVREQIYNEACQQPQILEGSHVLIFAATKNVDARQADEYMELIAQTRGIPLESLKDFRSYFEPIVAADAESNFKWTSRQAYIALGVGLVAAANEDVDATPMEGFSPQAIDKLFDLEARNLGSVCILTLGYRDEEKDYLAKAPKVRKAKDQLFEII